MNFRQFAIFAVVPALLSMSTFVRADILVTLTSTDGATGQTSSQTVVESGNTFVNGFTVNGSLFTVNSEISSPGQLTSNIAFYPTTLTSITVLVEDVTSGSTTTNYTLQQFQQNAPAGYSVMTSASQTSGADSFNGTAQVNTFNGTAPVSNNPALAPVSFTTAGGMTPAGMTNPNGFAAGPASSYTLGETYTLSGVKGYSLTNVGFTTTVSPSASPTTVSTTVSTAVPEPSVLVLTGLTTLGAGAFGLRRRFRVQSA